MITSIGAARHTRSRLTFLTLIIAVSLFVVSLAFLLAVPASASSLQDEPLPLPGPDNPDDDLIPDFPPNRRTLYKIKDRVYQHWMLTRLGDDPVECHLYMANVGDPGPAEVLGYCGMSVYRQWQEYVCYQTPDRETPCEGLTLHYIGPIDEALKVSIKLPGSVAYASLSDCPAWGTCPIPPQMTFGGIEPLTSHKIDLVHIEFEDNHEIVCAASECTIDMPFTPAEGMEVTYYVTSSYGDDSLKTSFLMRNILLADGTYLFQLIGPDWTKVVPASASLWGFFPALDIETITWLSDAAEPEGLDTSYDYAYLAGFLILRGDVDASTCVDGGLLPNEAASTCGLEKAREQVIAAQNRFNAEILAAANEYRIPPKLLKGLIGQESQFWNGWVIEGEYGYGMLTDEGADLLLTWHLPTFLELCIPAFGWDTCAWGYSRLADYPRAYLRGLALQDIGTEQEFDLIARTLYAAAGQAGQIVRNVTGEEPGVVTGYRDLWLMSLALYHGGGGCVGTAVEEAWDEAVDLGWGTVSEYLQGDCQLIADYPYRVTRYGDAALED